MIEVPGLLVALQAPSGPPDNSGYFHAAYVLVLLVYGGYAAVLLRRRARVRRTLDRLQGGTRGAVARGA